VTFSRPEFLAAAPPAMLLLWLTLLARRRRVRRLAEAYGDTAIGRLVPGNVLRFPAARLAVLLIAVLAICVAAAGPGEIANPGSSAAASLDIAIVVDASLSMNVADIEPTRIQRARDVVVRLSKEVPQARLSLVLFGDWPYTLVPPTDDPSVVAYFAQSLTGALVSGLAASIRTLSGDRSASLQAAVAHARAALDARPTLSAAKVILVISDGAIAGDEENVGSAVVAAAGKGAVVWTAGIGTDTVEMALDEQLLRSVAMAGRGVYENVSHDGGLQTLVSDLRRLSGVSGPEDVVPERITVCLVLLAMGALLWEGGLTSTRT
jgi:Ca-activated chloride channel homolog